MLCRCIGLKWSSSVIDTSVILESTYLLLFTPLQFTAFDPFSILQSSWIGQVFMVDIQMFFNFKCRQR